MEKYQLAKLVEWAGQFKSRKRLQKVVYLLQASGASIEADFGLHLYGPYSTEVARTTDEMVKGGLLMEDTEPNPAGRSFSYRLSDRAREQLARFKAPKLDAFLEIEDVARRLIDEPIAKLEYASTIAFFRRQGKPWNDARVAAAEFKNQLPESRDMKDAEALAREVLEPQGA